MPIQQAQPKRPPIVLIDSEADILSELALQAQSHSPQVSELLLQEIERAKLCERDKVAADVVTMMSHVEFIDEGASAGHKVPLVYPKDADAEAHRISILRPIGAGLIGTRVGQSISWPNRSGESRLLRIVAVTR
jgi:regulator of nucleoside diphosphate kinase